MLLKAIVFTLFLPLSFSTLLEEIENINKESSLSNAVVDIIIKNYAPKTSNVFVILGCHSDSHLYAQLGVVNNVIRQTSSLVTFVVEDSDSMNKKFERFYVLMFVESHEGFL